MKPYNETDPGTQKEKKIKGTEKLWDLSPVFSCKSSMSRAAGRRECSVGDTSLQTRSSSETRNIEEALPIPGEWYIFFSLIIHVLPFAIRVSIFRCTFLF